MLGPSESHKALNAVFAVGQACRLWPPLPLCSPQATHLAFQTVYACIPVLATFTSLERCVGNTLVHHTILGM